MYCAFVNELLVINIPLTKGKVNVKCYQDRFTVLQSNQIQKKKHGSNFKTHEGLNTVLFRI